MNQLTSKEKEVIELIKKNPFLEQEEIAKQLGITRSSVAGHLARLIKKGILRRGYILDENLEGIAVVGGANVDIKGIAEGGFKYQSSNPGVVHKTAGGVARNVAENLARLNVLTTLFTVVGNDEEGRWLLDVTGQAGVNIQHVAQFFDEKTGLYLSILNEKKEQIGSIADMQIMERFDQEIVQDIIPKLIHHKMVFVDTNLPKKSLNLIIEGLNEKKLPIIVDPVSVKKSAKLKDLLKGIRLITPNKEEAEFLSGIEIEKESDLIKVAEFFFVHGVEEVVITLGAKGVYVATPNKQQLLSSPNVQVKDTTGAGDAFLAGLIYGLKKYNDIFEACNYGSAMAAITLSRVQTVASDLTEDLLENTRKELF
ncbi:hypothetical protein BHF71_02255 [Vulcanibacillus modesticaldus]|uniref:Carbohydrate kinase PfkB domain-containing protein n=1 Tax=Vulcanibacillus modesticaldus TaxID=337097 RepID=A0A1D2YTK9_9BACI|nr:carbohydrate kinase [Vulcanibacillus modesticaldus]OEF99034.1 hypothetical protein BHF71_02255 [Vulcanibacillus modesticaldus]